jgi:hypothetical protein
MQPLLFALGMGGFDRPLPTMLKAMGWKMALVPFYFKVIHPSRFLQEISVFRSSPTSRTAANLAAATGIGWLGINTLQWIRSRTLSPLSVERVDEFGSWADHIWEHCSREYGFIGERGSVTLNILYPQSSDFLCLKVATRNRVAGWAVALDTQMSNNKHFGNLRVGSIVDCLAAPEDAHAIITAVTRVLQDRGVDLVIANHSHSEWGRAFNCAGFLEGPSNFIFAASPRLTEKIHLSDPNQLQIYCNRGDGDGPINL